MIKIEVFVAGLLGAAAGLALGSWIAPRPGLAGAADDAADARLAGIHAELREIRELLARAPAAGLSGQAVPPPAPAGAERTPHPMLQEEWIAVLRDLEQTLRGMSGAEGAPTQAAPPAAGSLWSEQPVDLDLAEVRSLRDSLPGDERMAEPGLFGLSPAQAYARFGTPSYIGNSADRVRWYYQDPNDSRSLVLTFMDGYLAWTHVADG